jgi:hypothetical protein
MFKITIKGYILEELDNTFIINSLKQFYIVSSKVKDYDCVSNTTFMYMLSHNITINEGYYESLLMLSFFKKIEYIQIIWIQNKNNNEYIIYDTTLYEFVLE